MICDIRHYVTRSFQISLWPIIFITFIEPILSKYMNVRILTAITALFLWFSANTQDIHYSQFYMAPLHLNPAMARSEEHTSELQSRGHLVCRLLLEKKNIHEQ